MRSASRFISSRIVTWLGGLGLLLGLLGCLSPRNKVVDVSNNPKWWGSLHQGEILKLREDALDGTQGVKTSVWIATGVIGAGETITPDDFRQHPERYERYHLYLLPKGTNLKCLKLERYFQSRSRGYLLYAEILDGEHRGRLTIIPVIGDPKKKGSLRFDTALLQPVE